MEVGYYVRTMNGKIYKIIDNDGGDYIRVENEYNGTYKIDISNTTKSSPNIIDLIEKKDIIKYHFNGFDYISEVFEYKNDLWVQNEDNMFEISEINIKSIVTKEQFESMEYKVGEQ